MRSPDVPFEHVHLRAGDKARQVFDKEIVLLFTVLLGDGPGMQLLWKTTSVMLLEEAVSRPPLGATYQAQWSVLDMGQDGLGHVLVIGNELRFGDPLAGIDHAVRAGQAHPELFRHGFAVVINGKRFFHANLPGGLVAAKTDKTGVAENVVGGQLGIGDLGHELGRDPMGAARPVLGNGVEWAGLARQLFQLQV
ncbi:hypothetical protein D3C87_1550870 [compost metagenome]